MRGICCCILAMLMGLICTTMASSHKHALEVGKFSNSRSVTELPPGWTPHTFSRVPQHTQYRMVQDDGQWVVRAESRASASALIRRMQIDPQRYPVLTWRWKIENILKKGDVTRKEGDDYPARLYVVFTQDPSELGWLDRIKYEAARALYGEVPPRGVLNYIWASNAPAGTQIDSPYAPRDKMIVVESGAEGINRWRTVERNVIEDYLSAFGDMPPPISAVAIMTDTDDTGESAVAYYGDIVFKAKP